MAEPHVVTSQGVTSQGGDELGGEARVGAYRLMKRLAVGGMGEVFLAAQETPYFTRYVALKRALPHLARERDFVERLIDEAKVMSGLHHGNIIHVHELKQDEWGLYMVMEYLPGADLRWLNQQLKRRGERWPPELAVWVIHEACLGLEYAHQARDEQGEPLHLIHRDLSPSNVLVGREGEVKLIDFGVVSARGSLHQSVAGSLQGKLAYVSPEQARGEPLTQRSDQFSLAVTLFELLAGRRPLEERDEASLLASAQRAAHMSLSELSTQEGLALDPHLCELVDRAMAAEASERFTGVSELTSRLHEWLQSQPTPPTRLTLKAWLTPLLDDELTALLPLEGVKAAPPPLGDEFTEALAAVDRDYARDPFLRASPSEDAPGQVTLTLSLNAQRAVQALEEEPALEAQKNVPGTFESPALEAQKNVPGTFESPSITRLKRARYAALFIAALASLMLVFNLSRVSAPLNPKESNEETKSPKEAPRAQESTAKEMEIEPQQMSSAPSLKELVVEPQNPLVKAVKSAQSERSAASSERQQTTQTSTTPSPNSLRSTQQRSTPKPKRARLITFELSPTTAQLSCNPPLVSLKPPSIYTAEGASCEVSAEGYEPQRVSLQGAGGLKNIRLKPLAQLNARVLPAAAELFLDGERLKNPLYRHQLKAGQHTIRGRLKVKGELWERELSFTLKEGQRESVVLELSAP